jgi:hypothetical protein
VKIINLISGPRNLSTALMYSFAQNPNTRVLDEPFYAHYLRRADVKVAHPGSAEILEALPNTKQEVLALIAGVSKTNKYVFIKGMAHHYLTKKPDYILSWSNMILIRHPEKLLASFAKVIENPTIDDIGIKKAAEIFTYLKARGKTPIVIDSDELLKNPTAYLEKICKLLHIPFSNAMMSWQKGGIEEDGVWAQYWYANVHQSRGFAVQKTSSQIMPERLSAVLDEAIVYYNILRNHILKNN